jgi:CHAD domain-containing protein
MELLPTSIAAMRICCKQEQVVANRTTQSRTHLAHALQRSAAVFGAQIELARGGDPKAIHRARVATRRLREALAVTGAALGGDAAVLRREFRAITAALGPARELDVSRKLLLELADASSWPADAVSRVEQHGLKERTKAIEKLQDVLEGDDAKVLARRVRAVARDVKDMDDSRLAGVIGSRYARRLREFNRELREAGTVYAGDRLHRVRIAAKKLRYLIEFGDTANEEALRRLKRLQKILGKLHDAQMVQHQLDEAAAAESVLGLHRSLRAMSRGLEAECRGWHGKALPLMLAPGALRRPARMAASARRKRSA